MVTRQHNNVDFDVSLECEALLLEKISAVGYHLHMHLSPSVESAEGVSV